MPFRPLSERSVRWRALGDGGGAEGLEHLHIRPVSSGIEIRSVVIGDRGGAAYGVSYEIDCDSLWRVRAFRLRALGGPSLDLSSDGAGRWFAADGTERADLAGCIDIDLAGTPFTNTLPIRRLAPTQGDPCAELTMLYVPFDTFEPFPDGQRYTALGPRRFLYEAADRSFSAELPLDEDGLVIDYPTLFERL
ncbi:MULTISPECIES: putative glycolipid-binding domain-containing protein [unclassified Aureimonas]|uniref:putative glycolipid-binding domain-containing protein n=1 Tax=unclassified Aureimonas TaxID=2615206 RepID=UPI0006FAAAC1|nr:MULTISPECIES: putative glycolipid-binding domain-containing protein [unclassified Aureimonas]KQT55134.1 transcriptional regulator [Aureimonas sp. Leaf427]KQT70923.1 transcriptional regulator [Aureimonas sp. Leaf460]